MPHQCAHWFAMTSLVGMRAPVHGCNARRFCQGTRIATPRRPKVRHALLWPKARAGQRSLGTPLPARGNPLRGPHALVRNDMQKAVACQRLQGVVRNDMQKAVACQRLQGRWFAMTCKRRMRVCGCKNVGRDDMQKTEGFLRVQGRWFAMTCRRQKRFCVCKGVTAFSTGR